MPKIAIPPRLRPAAAVAIGTASAPVAAYGGAIGIAILAAIAIGVIGFVIIPPASLRTLARPNAAACHRDLAVAGAAGIIAAAAGVASLLAVAAFISQRQAYIPNDSNHYDIVPVARLFSDDALVLATAAGVIVALVAGSLAVIAGRNLDSRSVVSDDGRSNISIFFAVAVCAIAASAAAGLIVTTLVQVRLNDAVAAEFYNSPYYIAPEPVGRSGMNANLGNLIFLVFPVIGFVAILFCAAVAGVVTSNILKSGCPGRRNYPDHGLNLIYGIALAVGASIFLAAVLVAVVFRYAAINSPYPYFGSPPGGWAVAVWYALVAASVAAAAIAPVLLSAAIAKLIAKAIAAASAPATNPPAPPPAT